MLSDCLLSLCHVVTFRALTMNTSRSIARARSKSDSTLVLCSTTTTMAIMDDRFEGDVMRLWNLVVDLSEQLSLTKSVASRLHNETIQLKVSVRHTSDGLLSSFIRHKHFTARRVLSSEGILQAAISQYLC